MSIHWVRKMKFMVFVVKKRVQMDRENSNVDEPNILDSSKINDANAEQTNSIVDDDVEQNDVSQNII
jgi:hypothetical protein